MPKLQTTPSYNSLQSKFEWLMYEAGFNLGILAITRDGCEYVSPTVQGYWKHFLSTGEI